ncbi:alpha/beta-type small acid-soluble spore protein [Tumebacillus sp. DT12]|uniref:Alpha/beta-type small acid-soluble spore protein n=1 Tax=Tumebacillus lacus TaxID=2995335 RepID=A0ABT3X3C7_9BACL|nr:alpha/beta-type small acid-soluble spore protein [Tumebacillus lacus]MCX7570473.1 alpha/beta-type small acid-soluble spore protein [Tumebacillus lacus]
MGNNRNRNRVEVPGARAALDHLKTEVASELGIPNYDQLDLGALPSRLNGKVGGLMVRKMIEFAEHAMQGSPQVLQAVEAEPGATQEDIRVAQQSMQAANAFVGQFNQTGQLPQQQMQATGLPLQAFNEQLQALNQQQPMPNPAMQQDAQAFLEGPSFQ